MIDHQLYKGREQTYVKHFFLQNYLERVAYNILSFSNEFVYVDGFSGPWKSANENFQDTSFKIAIERLRSIRDGFSKKGKTIVMRCLFVEKNATAFSELESAVADIDDIEIKLINGSFEDHIEDICKFIGQSFSLVFIDPTGWQGYPLEKLRPLLKLRGEVLINFMSDFINRFIDHPDKAIAQTFDDLFGGNWFEEWKRLNDQGMSREAAAIEVYTRRLKDAGDFAHVTFTRIMKPQSARTYFYLLYGTRHRKGLQEFRAVEKKAVDQQEFVRNAAQSRVNVEKTGQLTLLDDQTLNATTVNAYIAEKAAQMEFATASIDTLLEQNHTGIKFGDILAVLLERPLIWESDVKEMILTLKQNGKISINGMTPRQRVPKLENVIIPTGEKY